MCDQAPRETQAIKPTASELLAQAIPVHSGRIADIPIDQLTSSSLNNFQMDDEDNIEALADNIERIGLLSPLTVIDAPDGGKYEILSGGRRYRALSMLHEKDSALFPTIPCIIISLSDVTNDDIKGLIIQMANLEMRTDYNKDRHRIQVIELLSRLCKGKLSEHPDIAKKIARSFGITDRYLRMYLNIVEHAIDELKEAVMADASTTKQNSVSSDNNASDTVKEYEIGHIPIARAARIAEQDKKIQLSILDKMRYQGLSVEEAIDAELIPDKRPKQAAKAVQTWTKSMMHADVSTLNAEQREALQSILSLADHIRSQGLDAKLADTDKKDSADIKNDKPECADVNSETNIDEENKAD